MAQAASALRNDELSVDDARRLAVATTGTDRYPDGHALGVAACARRIADRLQLGLVARRAVVDGALLHDIGKLRVDASILDKPGPLTREERQRVNEHPVVGERLVRGMVSGDVADVVRSHHERWDGTGYPQGLSAEAIPLAARVVAVADAFLAMRERRPYRTALTEQAALDELKTCAGSQFDPSCVEALVAIIGDGDGAAPPAAQR